MVGLYVNNNTRERYAFRIICGDKTVETRTKRAARAFLNSGVLPGQRIAIIVNGKVYGYVTFEGIKNYETLEEFRADTILHKVAPGSAFDFDPKRGKVGLVFSNPKVREMKDWNREVKRLHGYTWTTV